MEKKKEKPQDDSSYYSTSIRVNQKIIVPTECEFFVKGIDGTSKHPISMSFKLPRGAKIVKED